MCPFFDLTEENNTFETTVTYNDGTIKDKSRTITEKTIKKFEKYNKMVRGHLLKHMINPLFDLFINFKSAKIIWEKLEIKYGPDNAREKKYVVGE